MYLLVNINNMFILVPKSGGGGGVPLLFFSKERSTLKMHYFYPIFTKFYDKREGF